MADHDGPRLPAVPKVRYPERLDPGAGVDWTKEPFHRAFFTDPLNRDGLPAGFVAMVYAFVLFALIAGLYVAVRWWTGG